MKIPVVQVASDKRMSTVLCTRAILPHEVVQATSENDKRVGPFVANMVVCGTVGGLFSPARAPSVGGIRAGSFSVCQLLAALARTAIFCPAVSRISMVSTSSMVTGVAPVTLARPWAVAFQLAARS